MTTTEIERNAQTVFEAVRDFPLEPKVSSYDPTETWVDWEDLEAIEVPGFEFLGQGGSRMAFLKDGLVYKVEYQEAHGDADHWMPDNNLREFTQWFRINDMGMPFGWRIPVTDMVIVHDEFPVIVMEYVPGTYFNDDDYELADVANVHLGLCDLGYSNCLKAEDGTYWILDFAQ